MNIEEINIARPELLETGFDRQVERLVAVSSVVHLDGDAVIPTFIIGGELGVSRSQRWILVSSDGADMPL